MSPFSSEILEIQNSHNSHIQDEINRTITLINQTRQIISLLQEKRTVLINELNQLYNDVVHFDALGIEFEIIKNELKKTADTICVLYNVVIRHAIQRVHILRTQLTS